MGIGKTLCSALAELLMRAAGYQLMMACGNLQLCAGLEAVVGGESHTVGERRRERSVRRREEESGNEAEDEEEE